MDDPLHQAVIVLVAELFNDWDIIQGDSLSKLHSAELRWERGQLP